ncbi:O-antigen ligase family protein [Labilibaculum euxinus]
MKSQLLRYYFFFAFLFLLLFLEDRVFLMGISLSNIWKIVVIACLMLFIGKKKISLGISYFDISVLFLSLSFLINGHGFFTMDDIEEVILILIFPVSYNAFYYLYRNKPDKLKSDLLIFATFLLLTTIPFLLGILEPVSDFNESRAKFVEGYELNSNILVGFFKQPALSSKVFVFSTVIVGMFGIYMVKGKVTNRLFFLIVLVLGLYDVYLAFTRTGWIMLIAFIFIFIFLNKSKSSFKKIFFITSIVFALAFVFKSNVAIQNRLLGNNINKTSQAGDIDNISSGRTILMALAINSVLEDNNMSLFFGLGRKYALEKNYGALAHNRFIEIFTFGGLVSVFLYLFYLFQMYKEIHKRKSKRVAYILSLSLFLIMLLALLPSHGLALWADVLFGGVIAFNRLEFENEDVSLIQQPIV